MQEVRLALLALHDRLNHVYPALGGPGCSMRPAAIFESCVYSAHVTQYKKIDSISYVYIS